MELTSVYWIPIFELLDARGFAVFLVNARDAKHVPGRKTDVSDAEWLQRLHSYGLRRRSFRPKGRIVELRAYLRQRERLLEYGASHIQHMQKALTEMNVQLHHVVTDITGATGLRIVRELAGERDPLRVSASLGDSRGATTGGVFAIAGKVGLEQVAWLSPSRWGYALTASTSNLNKIFPPQPGTR